MNIVQIEHKGYPVRYTFEVPEGVRLHKGDIVQVKDKRGYHIVECVTDSHEVDEELLDMIMDGKQVTASVTGIYKLDDFNEKTVRRAELSNKIDLSYRVLEAMNKEEISHASVFSDPNGGRHVKLGFERCKAAVLHAISEVNDGNK